MFYSLYSVVRDIHGENDTAGEQATTNAHRIISLERYLHVFKEESFQRSFIHHRLFMEFWDGYYGTTHFLAVAAVLIVLFFRFPDRYRLWRNTLALTTGLALIGFAFFPLLPPRLLGHPYHFVDSLDTIGGLWTFKAGAISEVSNQYAAMPSLHTAWSMWAALAVSPVIKTRWRRPVLVAYPAATVFCIVVTANHYLADAVAGLGVLGVAYLLALLITPRIDRLHRDRAIMR